MHDIRFIREHPEVFDHALQRRGMPASAAEIMTLDAEKRASQTAAQELLAKRNTLSKEIGQIKGKGGNADAQMQEVASIKEKITALELQEQEFGTKLNEILSSLPNIPAMDVPEGKDEKDNKELRRSGEPKRINSAKEHFDLGEALGYMDFTTAAKLSGARFTMLKGPLARLERALGNFMLDIHTNDFGYQEISPPLMVREEIMYGTGQLPKFRQDQFKVSGISLFDFERLTSDATAQAERLRETGVTDISVWYKQMFDLGMKFQEKIKAGEYSSYWLIPTAEVPLTNIVNNEIVNREELPFRFTAKTPCFRAEAGAAGKDTRGMLRQHQFYKVEMVSITTPDQSEAEHDRMTECAETVLKKLELPFRTMVLCSGDMGFASRKTYDIEVWMPGQNTYREISSCSNCGDFQARRMNARTKGANEKHTEFVHTLNGSGVAVGRCLIAIMENFQESDGSVSIPSALRPYMGGMERIQVATK